jgi:hypothetical protein
MAHGQKKVDSVYDFLYVDAPRIHVLLSQFGQDGVLTELTRATDASSETGGGFDVKIAKLDAKESEKTGLTRRFDPQWLTPLNFLDAARDIIVRDISSARIGQIVLASGAITITDFAMLRLLWDIPAVQNMIASGMNSTSFQALLPPKAGKSSENQATKALMYQVKQILEIIKVIPHATIAMMKDTGGNEIWGAIKNEQLTVSSSTLMLNHGSSIHGKWNVVGILDALPESKDPSSDLSVPDTSVSMISIMQGFGPIARSLLGRPETAYGVTPLMIFREIESA